MALISLRGITKTYLTGTVEYQALAGVDLDVDEGEFIAVMGPSGSGKSTAMHIIGALDTPTRGTYTLSGRDISQLSEDKLADIRNREIGFVFQSFNLLPRTSVLKNVERPMVYGGVGPVERRERSLAALRLLGLEDRVNNHPNQLSGGETQRVAIARAVVMNPAIILADEPTGNLDTKTTHQIMEFFEDLNAQGHTIVLITHERDVAAFARRIVSLKDGKIVGDKRNPRREGGP